MDLLLDICRGLGLALAAAVATATVFALVLGGARHPARRIGVVLAAIGGAAAFYIGLDAADRTAWPGIPLGALAGLFAAATINDVIAGAAAREGASLAGIGLIVLGAALLLAAFSALAPPVALVALVGLFWLGTSRRSREAEKYEGLRVLR
jgi:hypothetical protein